MNLGLPTATRAILFDIYGTLLEIGRPTHPYKRLLRWAQAQGAGAGNGFSPSVVVMSRQMTLIETAQWLNLSLSADQKRELARDLALELDSIRLFPEVPVVLSSLRDCGYRLGVCSNLATPYVAPARQLLKPFIDAAIWSCEVGLVKPDPEIYRMAARQLGVPVAAVLMVGDTHRTDVAGPQAAGLKALLLDRRQISPASGDSLPSLEALLQG